LARLDTPPRLVASGSQGVLDALGKVLISKGDTVAVEAPTYLGALQAFTPYEPQYARLDTDDNGLIPESREKVLDLEKLYWKAVEKNVAFVPGKYFYSTPGEGIETMRRNFTMAEKQPLNGL